MDLKNESTSTCRPKRRREPNSKPRFTKQRKPSLNQEIDDANERIVEANGYRNINKSKQSKDDGMKIETTNESNVWKQNQWRRVYMNVRITQ
jgi:hypothetical protein